MSTAVSKGPCPCGSSDGNVLYDDGHSYCFVCHRYTGTAGGGGTHAHQHQEKRISGLITDYKIAPLKTRGIAEATCKKWDYGCTKYKGEWVQVANYRDEHGNVVGQKVRWPDKRFVIFGDIKPAGLYGQWLWRDGGKKVVITEGEIDALTVSQLQDLKWPVVSVPNGAAGAKAAVQRSLEWLEKFDEVVFMFDMDEPGRKAARECAELLSPGKAKVAQLSMKDPNELLVANKGAEVIAAMWGAKTFRPDGIINGVELWEKITEVDSSHSLPYKWGGLQQMTYGCRTGEIVTVCAGSGIGKSAIVRELAHDFLTTHQETVGYVALEENTKRSALGFVGLEMGRRLHLGLERVDNGEMRAAFDRTVGSGRLFLYDHWGSTDSDNLLARIRYLVRGCGCRTVVLDHLSIVVSGAEDGDERRLIDNTMTKLRTLVEEVQCRLLLVSHLKRPDGKGHEEGAMTSLSQLRGSAAIGQLSDIVLGLERDQQHPTNKSITCVRVLKNRFSGDTGEACWLKYDGETGRLTETPKPADDDGFAEEPDEGGGAPV